MGPSRTGEDNVSSVVGVFRAFPATVPARKIRLIPLWLGNFQGRNSTKYILTPLIYPAIREIKIRTIARFNFAALGMVKIKTTIDKQNKTKTTKNTSEDVEKEQLLFTC